MTKVARAPFVGGFLAGALFISLANFYSITGVQDRMCFDCGLPAGFPFTMYRTDSFVGGGGFIASGVFANACVSVILGAVFGLVSSLIGSSVRIRFHSRKLR